MGTLTPGDQVFDESGRPCNIVAFSEIDDTEQCYRLIFRDGSHIDAGASGICYTYIYYQQRQPGKAADHRGNLSRHSAVPGAARGR